MKFLVIWELELARLTTEVARAVMRMPDYGKKVAEQGKLTNRYHMVGKHGGAWIFDVDSNEELERLLAMSPVYNFTHYAVYPLADMDTPSGIAQPGEAAHGES